MFDYPLCLLFLYLYLYKSDVSILKVEHYKDIYPYSCTSI